MIEKIDAEAIEVGEKITLMKWGNVNITKKESDGDVLHLTGVYDDADKDFKGTKKIGWLISDPDHTLEIDLAEMDHLITKEKIEEADEIENIVNQNSLVT